MRELTQQEREALSDNYHADAIYWDWSSYQAGFTAGIETQDERVAELVKVLRMVQRKLEEDGAEGIVAFDDEEWDKIADTLAKYETGL